LYDVAVELEPVALLSMNEVMPVVLAPVRGVRDVPLDALDGDVAAPLVPIAPDCSPAARQPLSVIGCC
jgi:hypothetical protein